MGMGELSPCAAVTHLLVLLLLLRSPPLRAPRYDAIVSFGDSFADTGNNPVVFGWYSVFDTAMRSPYGSTFFAGPTGRCSDGRLAIDFVAQGLGLPLVPPFLAVPALNGSSFCRGGGANFAVGGSTALDAGFFHDGGAGGSPFPLNTSLDVQLQWFESLRPSLCTNQDCKEFFGRSLFFVGEFGFNDYAFAMGRMSVQQVKSSLVPDVIRAISMAVERLIKHGATSLVVPGTIPAGCVPQILAFFGSGDPADYDPRTGCLTAINDLAVHHNSLLQEALRGLRAEHSGADIAYADFFGPVMEMVESPGKFGPGSYNGHNGYAVCGDPGVPTCEDPSARVFWDDVHFTEEANRYVADGWMRSINRIAGDASSSQ